MSIQSHPGKANIVVDALSQKSLGDLACLFTTQPQLIKELRKLKLENQISQVGENLYTISTTPSLLDKVKQKQCINSYLEKIKEEIMKE